MSYKIIKNSASAEISVKRSKFIANIAPCKTAQEALDFINKISSLYHDAKHNCYAFRTITEENFSDDKEPKGTAGKPIMDVIKHNEIFNCVIVVTRYFGGILLGAGGLVHAYSDAALNALNKTETAFLHKASVFEGEFDYKDLNLIQSLCDVNEYKIENMLYTDKIKANIVIPQEQEELFLNLLEDKSNGNIKFFKIKEDFCFF